MMFDPSCVRHWFWKYIPAIKNSSSDSACFNENLKAEKPGLSFIKVRDLPNESLPKTSASYDNSISSPYSVLRLCLKPFGSYSFLVANPCRSLWPVCCLSICGYWDWELSMIPFYQIFHSIYCTLLLKIGYRLRIIRIKLSCSVSMIWRPSFLPFPVCLLHFFWTSATFTHPFSIGQYSTTAHGEFVE